MGCHGHGDDPAAGVQVNNKNPHLRFFHNDFTGACQYCAENKGKKVTVETRIIQRIPVDRFLV